MKPSTNSVYEMFVQDRLYVTPHYQRPYVWQKDSWTLLWQDIEESAHRALEQDGGNMKYFLGALVTSSIKVYGNQNPQFMVIDGQQRLTTLQLFFKALYDLCIEHQNTHEAKRLEKVIQNDAHPKLPLDRYKVQPTETDQSAFRAVMDAGSQAQVAHSSAAFSRFALAYDFFCGHLRTFLGLDGGAHPIQDRLDALIQAVQKRLQVVHIELEDEDDPQVIFETLNARGVPLLPSDLVRNLILGEATRTQGSEDETVQSLYELLWKPYEEEPDPELPGVRFWAVEQKQGRYKKSRLDLFFFHLLRSELGREVQIKNLYAEFRVWWQGKKWPNVRAGLEYIRTRADIFKRLFVRAGEERFDRLAARFRTFEVLSAAPFLILLESKRGSLPHAEYLAILASLESYVIRRALCGLEGKGYNKTFVDLVRVCHRDGLSRETVDTALRSFGGVSNRWPNDVVLKQEIIGQPLYQTLKAQKVRVVLEALDLFKTDKFQEKVHLSGPTTVEHVMPQSWESRWLTPIIAPGETSAQAVEQRKVRIHTLGNLTLLTGSLNSGLSNDSYAEKRERIIQNSALRLNVYFQKVTEWDDQAILERGVALFEDARLLWPYPTP